MSLKVVFLGSAVVLASTSIGMAQDYGDVDWTGGYIGGSVLYTNTESNAAFVPSSPYAAVPIKSNPSGISLNVQSGINQQAGKIVFGVEGDVSFGNIAQTFTDPLLGSPDTVTASSDFQGSLRGRFGIAANNFLPYVTGGIALAHLKTAATNSVDVPLSDEGFGYGWVAGVGIEVALDDSWSVRAEYLHSDLAAGNFYKGQNYENSAHPVSDTVAVGVNYRFQ